MLVRIHWKALKIRENSTSIHFNFFFLNIELVIKPPYSRQSDSWNLPVWGWLYQINSNKNTTRPLYGTRSYKVHAIHKLFPIPRANKCLLFCYKGRKTTSASLKWCGPCCWHVLVTAMVFVESEWWMVEATGCPRSSVCVSVWAGSEASHVIIVGFVNLNFNPPPWV